MTGVVSTDAVARGSVAGPMDEPALLQTGPETFELVLAGGERRRVRLPVAARRDLGLRGVPPLTVAIEIVRFLDEHGDVPPDGASLIVLAGRHPGFVDELRVRLS